MGITVSKKKKGKYSPNDEDLTASGMLRGYSTTAEGAAYGATGSLNESKSKDKKKAKKDMKREKKEKKDKKKGKDKGKASSSVESSLSDMRSAVEHSPRGHGAISGPQTGRYTQSALDIRRHSDSSSDEDTSTSRGTRMKHDSPAQRHTQSSIDVRPQFDNNRPRLNNEGASAFARIPQTDQMLEQHERAKSSPDVRPRSRQSSSSDSEKNVGLSKPSIEVDNTVIYQDVGSISSDEGMRPSVTLEEARRPSFEDRNELDVQLAPPNIDAIGPSVPERKDSLSSSDGDRSPSCTPREILRPNLEKKSSLRVNSRGEINFDEDGSDSESRSRSIHGSKDNLVLEPPPAYRADSMDSGSDDQAREGSTLPPKITARMKQRVRGQDSDSSESSVSEPDVAPTQPTDYVISVPDIGDHRGEFVVSGTQVIQRDVSPPRIQRDPPTYDEWQAQQLQMSFNRNSFNLPAKEDSSSDEHVRSTHITAPEPKKRLYKKREGLESSASAKPSKPVQIEEKHVMMLKGESSDSSKSDSSPELPKKKPGIISDPSMDIDHDRGFQAAEWPRSAFDDDAGVQFYEEMAIDVPPASKPTHVLNTQHRYYNQSPRASFEEMPIDVELKISSSPPMMGDLGRRRSSSSDKEPEIIPEDASNFDVSKLKQIESNTKPILVRRRSKNKTSHESQEPHEDLTRHSALEQFIMKPLDAIHDGQEIEIKPIESGNVTTALRGEQESKSSDSDDSSTVEVVVVRGRTDSDRRKKPVSRQNATQIIVDNQAEEGFEIPIHRAPHEKRDAMKAKSVDLSKAFTRVISREEFQNRRAQSLPEDSEQYNDIDWTTDELEQWRKIEGANVISTETTEKVPNERYFLMNQQSQESDVDYRKLPLAALVQRSISGRDDDPMLRVHIDRDSNEFIERNNANFNVERPQRVSSPEEGLPVLRRKLVGYYDDTADVYLQKQFPDDFAREESRTSEHHYPSVPLTGGGGGNFKGRKGGSSSSSDDSDKESDDKRRSQNDGETRRSSQFSNNVFFRASMERPQRRDSSGSNDMRGLHIQTRQPVTVARDRINIDVGPSDLTQDFRQDETAQRILRKLSGYSNKDVDDLNSVLLSSPRPAESPRQLSPRQSISEITVTGIHIEKRPLEKEPSIEVVSLQNRPQLQKQLTSDYRQEEKAMRILGKWGKKDSSSSGESSDDEGNRKVLAPTIDTPSFAAKPDVPIKQVSLRPVQQNKSWQFRTARKQSVSDDSSGDEGSKVRRDNNSEPIPKLPNRPDIEKPTIIARKPTTPKRDSSRSSDDDRNRQKGSKTITDVDLKPNVQVKKEFELQTHHKPILPAKKIGLNQSGSDKSSGDDSKQNVFRTNQSLVINPMLAKPIQKEKKISIKRISGRKSSSKSEDSTDDETSDKRKSKDITVKPLTSSKPDKSIKLFKNQKSKPSASDDSSDDDDNSQNPTKKTSIFKGIKKLITPSKSTKKDNNSSGSENDSSEGRKKGRKIPKMGIGRKDGKLNVPKPRVAGDRSDHSSDRSTSDHESDASECEYTVNADVDFGIKPEISIKPKRIEMQSLPVTIAHRNPSVEKPKTIDVGFKKPRDRSSSDSGDNSNDERRPKEIEIKTTPIIVTHRKPSNEQPNVGFRKARDRSSSHSSSDDKKPKEIEILTTPLTVTHSKPSIKKPNPKGIGFLKTRGRSSSRSSGDERKPTEIEKQTLPINVTHRKPSFEKPKPTEIGFGTYRENIEKPKKTKIDFKQTLDRSNSHSSSEERRPTVIEIQTTPIKVTHKKPSFEKPTPIDVKKARDRSSSHSDTDSSDERGSKSLSITPKPVAMPRRSRSKTKTPSPKINVKQLKAPEIKPRNITINAEKPQPLLVKRDRSHSSDSHSDKDRMRPSISLKPNQGLERRRSSGSGSDKTKKEHKRPVLAGKRESSKSHSSDSDHSGREKKSKGRFPKFISLSGRGKKPTRHSSESDEERRSLKPIDLQRPAVSLPVRRQRSRSNSSENETSRRNEITIRPPEFSVSVERKDKAQVRPQVTMPVRKQRSRSNSSDSETSRRKNMNPNLPTPTFPGINGSIEVVRPDVTVPVKKSRSRSHSSDSDKSDNKEKERRFPTVTLPGIRQRSRSRSSGSDKSDAQKKTREWPSITMPGKRDRSRSRSREREKVNIVKPTVVVPERHGRSRSHSSDSDQANKKKKGFKLPKVSLPKFGRRSHSSESDQEEKKNKNPGKPVVKTDSHSSDSDTKQKGTIRPTVTLPERQRPRSRSHSTDSGKSDITYKNRKIPSVAVPVMKLKTDSCSSDSDTPEAKEKKKRKPFISLPGFSGKRNRSRSKSSGSEHSDREIKNRKMPVITLAGKKNLSGSHSSDSEHIGKDDKIRKKPGIAFPFRRERSKSSQSDHSDKEDKGSKRPGFTLPFRRNRSTSSHSEHLDKEIPQLEKPEVTPHFKRGRSMSSHSEQSDKEDKGSKLPGFNLQFRRDRSNSSHSDHSDKDFPNLTKPQVTLPLKRDRSRSSHSDHSVKDNKDWKKPEIAIPLQRGRSRSSHSEHSDQEDKGRTLQQPTADINIQRPSVNLQGRPKSHTSDSDHSDGKTGKQKKPDKKVDKKKKKEKRSFFKLPWRRGKDKPHSSDDEQSETKDKRQNIKQPAVKLPATKERSRSHSSESDHARKTIVNIKTPVVAIPFKRDRSRSRSSHSDHSDKEDKDRIKQVNIDPALPSVTLPVKQARETKSQSSDSEHSDAETKGKKLPKVPPRVKRDRSHSSDSEHSDREKIKLEGPSLSLQVKASRRKSSDSERADSKTTERSRPLISLQGKRDRSRSRSSSNECTDTKRIELVPPSVTLPEFANKRRSRSSQSEHSDTEFNRALINPTVKARSRSNSSDSQHSDKDIPEKKQAFIKLQGMGGRSKSRSSQSEHSDAEIINLKKPSMLLPDATVKTRSHSNGSEDSDGKKKERSRPFISLPGKPERSRSRSSGSADSGGGSKKRKLPSVTLPDMRRRSRSRSSQSGDSDPEKIKFKDHSDTNKKDFDRPFITLPGKGERHGSKSSHSSHSDAENKPLELPSVTLPVKTVEARPYFSDSDDSDRERKDPKRPFVPVFGGRDRSKSHSSASDRSDKEPKEPNQSSIKLPGLPGMLNRQRSQSSGSDNSNRSDIRNRSIDIKPMDGVFRRSNSFSNQEFDGLRLRPGIEGRQNQVELRANKKSGSSDSDSDDDKRKQSMLLQMHVRPGVVHENQDVNLPVPSFGRQRSPKSSSSDIEWHSAREDGLKIAPVVAKPRKSKLQLAVDREKDGDRKRSDSSHSDSDNEHVPRQQYAPTGPSIHKPVFVSELKARQAERLSVELPDVTTDINAHISPPGGVQQRRGSQSSNSSEDEARRRLNVNRRDRSDDESSRHSRDSFVLRGGIDINQQRDIDLPSYDELSALQAMEEYNRRRAELGLSVTRPEMEIERTEAPFKIPDNVPPYETELQSLKAVIRHQNKQGGLSSSDSESNDYRKAKREQYKATPYRERVDVSLNRGTHEMAVDVPQYMVDREASMEIYENEPGRLAALSMPSIDASQEYENIDFARGRPKSRGGPGKARDRLSVSSASDAESKTSQGAKARKSKKDSKGKDDSKEKKKRSRSFFSFFRRNKSKDRENDADAVRKKAEKKAEKERKKLEKKAKKEQKKKAKGKGKGKEDVTPSQSARTSMAFSQESLYAHAAVDSDDESNSSKSDDDHSSGTNTNNHASSGQQPAVPFTTSQESLGSVAAIPKESKIKRSFVDKARAHFTRKNSNNSLTSQESIQYATPYIGDGKRRQAITVDMKNQHIEREVNSSREDTLTNASDDRELINEIVDHQVLPAMDVQLVRPDSFMLQHVRPPSEFDTHFEEQNTSSDSCIEELEHDDDQFENVQNKPQENVVRQKATRNDIVEAISITPDMDQSEKSSCINTISRVEELFDKLKDSEADKNEHNAIAINVQLQTPAFHMERDESEVNDGSVEDISITCNERFDIHEKHRRSVKIDESDIEVIQITTNEEEQNKNKYEKQSENDREVDQDQQHSDSDSESDGKVAMIRKNGAEEEFDNRRTMPQLIRSLQDIHTDGIAPSPPVRIQSCEELLRYSMIKTNSPSANSSRREKSRSLRSVGDVIRKGSDRIRRSLQKLRSQSKDISEPASGDYRDPHVNDMHKRLNFIERITMQQNLSEPSHEIQNPDTTDDRNHNYGQILQDNEATNELIIDDTELEALNVTVHCQSNDEDLSDWDNSDSDKSDKRSDQISVEPISTKEGITVQIQDGDYAQLEDVVAKKVVEMNFETRERDHFDVSTTSSTSSKQSVIAMQKHSYVQEGENIQEESQNTESLNQQHIDRQIQQVTQSVPKAVVLDITFDPSPPQNTEMLVGDYIRNYKTHNRDEYSSEPSDQSESSFGKNLNNSFLMVDIDELNALRALIRYHSEENDTAGLYTLERQPKSVYTLERPPKGANEVDSTNETTTRPKHHGISNRATMESGDYSRVIEDEELASRINGDTQSSQRHPQNGGVAEERTGEAYYSVAEEREQLMLIARGQTKASGSESDNPQKKTVEREEAPHLEPPKVPPKEAVQDSGVTGPKFFTDKPLNRLPLRVKRQYPDVFRLSQEFLDEYLGDSELSESDFEDMEGYHPAGLFEHVAKMSRMPDTPRDRDPILLSHAVRVRTDLDLGEKIGVLTPRPIEQSTDESDGSAAQVIQVAAAGAITAEQSVSLKASPTSTTVTHTANSVADTLPTDRIGADEKQQNKQRLHELSSTNGSNATVTQSKGPSDNLPKERIESGKKQHSKERVHELSNTTKSDKENRLTEGQGTDGRKEEGKHGHSSHSHKHKHRSRDRADKEKRASSAKEDDREKKQKEREERRKREKKEKRREREKLKESILTTTDDEVSEKHRKSRRKSKSDKTETDSDATLTNEVSPKSDSKSKNASKSGKDNRSSKKDKERRDRKEEKDGERSKERDHKRSSSKSRSSKEKHEKREHSAKDKKSSLRRRAASASSLSEVISETESERHHKRSRSKSRSSKEKHDKENLRRSEKSRSERHSGRDDHNRHERSSKDRRRKPRRRTASTGSVIELKSGRNMRALPKIKASSMSSAQRHRKQELQRHLDVQKVEASKSEEFKLVAQMLINDVYLRGDKQVKRLMDDAFPLTAAHSKQSSERKSKHKSRDEHSANEDVSLPPLSPGSHRESTHSIQTEPIRVPKKHSNDSERPTSALNMLYSEGSLHGYSPRSAVNSYMPVSHLSKYPNPAGAHNAWPVSGAVGNSYERERLLEAVRQELRCMKPS